MADDRSKPITKADVEKFIESVSDFSFEMKVLSVLSELGFKCRHAGTYRDPLTDKTRQFDVRATRSDQARDFTFVVECKNLREYCPLLVHTTDRTEQEAYHCLITRKLEQPSFPEISQVGSPMSPYALAGAVGKKTDQVKRSASGYDRNDSDAFEKIGQALNGTFDEAKSAVGS